MIPCSSVIAAASSTETSSIASASWSRRALGSGVWAPASSGATRPSRSTPAKRPKRRRRDISRPKSLNNTSNTSNSGGQKPQREVGKGNSGAGPEAGSDVQEAAEPDPGPDGADEGAADQEPDADRTGVPGGHEEPLEEALGRVELAQQVLQREHAAHGEPRADGALHQPFGHEGDADEPVRRADELHDLDLTPAGERRQAD